MYATETPRLASLACQAYPVGSTRGDMDSNTRATLPRIARQKVRAHVSSSRAFDGHTPALLEHSNSLGQIAARRGVVRPARRITPGITVRTNSDSSHAPLPCSPLTDTTLTPRQVWARGASSRSSLQSVSPASAASRSPVGESQQRDGAGDGTAVLRQDDAQRNLRGSPLASGSWQGSRVSARGHGGARPARGSGVQGGYSHTLQNSFRLLQDGWNTTKN